MQPQKAITGLQCPSQSVLDGMAVIMILSGVTTFITLIWGCMPAGYGRYMHHMSPIGDLNAHLRAVHI